jgi:hypothetical protein
MGRERCEYGQGTCVGAVLMRKTLATIIALASGGIACAQSGSAWPPYGGVGAGGTVTTVSAGNLSPLFTTSVTSPGTTPALSFTANTQSPNYVMAGPVSGSTALVPTFRALVSLDIPNNAANTTGSAQSVVNSAGTTIFSGPTTTDVLTPYTFHVGNLSSGIEITNQQYNGNCALCVRGTGDGIGYQNNQVFVETNNGSVTGDQLAFYLAASPNSGTGYSTNSTVDIDANTVSLQQGERIGWSSLTTGAGTALTQLALDTGMSRTSAGVISMDTGTKGNGLGSIIAASYNGQLNGSTTTTDAATIAIPITKRQSYVALTANTTFTLASGQDGQEITLVWAQNATTAYTVTQPTNVHGFTTIGATLSKYSSQHFTYSTVAALWLADGPGVQNE